MARLLGRQGESGNQEGRDRDRRRSEGYVIDLLLLTNESDHTLDRVIRWLCQNEPEMSVQRINRECPAGFDMMSAFLDAPDWRVRGSAPRVTWLRQLLPERDPYGPVPKPDEIDVDTCMVGESEAEPRHYDPAVVESVQNPGWLQGRAHPG